MMKIATKSSAIITLVAIAFYLVFFIILEEVPNVERFIPFTGKLLPFELSRAFDLLVLFPFFLSMVLLIMYLKNIEEINYKLYRWIRWEVTVTFVLAFMFAIEMDPMTGLMVGLSLCFLFGIGSMEFAVTIGIIFGLTIWIIAAVKSGLILGFIPGIVASLIFGSAALLGFGLKKVLSLKK